MIVIEGRYKPRAKKDEKGEGERIKKSVKKINSVIDSGGIYYVIETADNQIIESYKLEWFIIFHMPHQEDARAAIKKIIADL